MMPDLGKYAFSVLASYGVSLFLLAGLIFASVARAWRIKAKLDQVEARKDG